MKILLVLSFITCYSLSSFAQDEVISISQKSDVYNYHVLENKPLFGNTSKKEDSEKAFKEFIQNQIDSLDLNQGNKTFVSFEIDKDGSIQNAKVLVGENENFNKAVVDLVTKSPKWKPATKNNEAVKSSYLFEASN